MSNILRVSLPGLCAIVAIMAACGDDDATPQLDAGTPDATMGTATDATTTSDDRGQDAELEDLDGSMPCTAANGGGSRGALPACARGESEFARCLVRMRARGAVWLGRRAERDASSLEEARRSRNTIQLYRE